MGKKAGIGPAHTYTQRVWGLRARATCALNRSRHSFPRFSSSRSSRRRNRSRHSFPRFSSSRSSRRRRLALSCATSPSTSSLSIAAAAPLLHTATVPAASPPPCARTSGRPASTPRRRPPPPRLPPPLPTAPRSPASSPRRPRIAQKNWPRWRSFEPSGEPSRRSTRRRRLFPGAAQVLLRSLPVLSGSWIRLGSGRSPPPSRGRQKWVPASSEGSRRPGSPSSGRDSCPGARGPACDPKVRTTG